MAVGMVISPKPSLAIASGSLRGGWTSFHIWSSPSKLAPGREKICIVMASTYSSGGFAMNQYHGGFQNQVSWFSKSILPPKMN